VKNGVRNWGPWVLLGLVLLATGVQLRLQERLWLCSCGHVLLWSGNINSSDNSQQLFDPYSFTHVLHGFVFLGLAALLTPALSATWQFVVALSAEGVWEVIENTRWVIDRYRAETISLGYTGDTILNSFGDIAACALGIFIATRLGLKWTLVLAGVIEGGLLFLIRDNLLLNIVMLVYPIEAIKVWQSGL
jgi:hypothetical protein